MHRGPAQVVVEVVVTAMRAGSEKGGPARSSTLFLAALVSFYTGATSVLLIAAVAILVPSPARASLGRASLSAASIETSGAVSELHFGFSGPAPAWNLTAHNQQLWIDLPNTRSRVLPRPLYGEEAAPIGAVRVLDDGQGGVRIVVEVEGKVDFAIARLRSTIVLRVAPSGSMENLAAPLLALGRERVATRRKQPRLPSGAQAPAAALAGRASGAESAAQSTAALAPAQASSAIERGRSAGAPLVMIDPGHGGYDPGTSSASGIEEKDLALQIALRLDAALRARGIRTAMTRTTDVFVPLSDRTRLANRADADLFVSIHLNSSPNPETTGIEVYYLNNTTDHATIRLARMENIGAPASYGASGGANLNYILTDLKQQYKANSAASLARMIDVQTVADLNSEFGAGVNALGAKMGPFYVLVGANMPSVLVECGFLSNSGEARRLASSGYQQVLAQGIADAIVHYFKADVAVGNL